MNGATADPWLKTINIPNKARTIKIGINQYFFLSLTNSINSFKKDIIKIDVSLNQVVSYVLSNMYLFYCHIFYLVNLYLKFLIKGQLE